MTATNDNPARTAETYRRRSLHQLAIAITNGHGWNRERADTYHHALRDHDPRDVDTACQHLLTTWDRSVLPPPATILNEANQARDTRARSAAASRATTTQHDHGIRRTEWNLLAPLCHRCNGNLLWLTHENITYCPACNAAQIQDNHTGRVKLTQPEKDTIVMDRGSAAWPPNAHLHAVPDTEPDGVSRG